jgi:hypothetical protein
MTTLLKGQPVAAADLAPEWIADRRAIAHRDGHALRAGLDLTIEVQSINTGEWHPLCLPTEGTRFVSSVDRDAVLAALQGGAS